jgi:hypothetical protein
MTLKTFISNLKSLSIMTYKIENNYFQEFLSQRLDTIVKLNKSIDDSLNHLDTLLNPSDFFYTGRGGNHIWISDVWKKRVAIIYFPVS